METKQFAPDTCQCILEVTFGPGIAVTFVDFIQKCFIHKGFNGQTLAQEVANHNRGFQISQNASDNDKKQNKIDKKNEKARIRTLGKPVRNTT